MATENNGGTAVEGFEEFAASGDVEVGKPAGGAAPKGDGEGDEDGEKPAAKPKPAAKTKPAIETNAEDAGEGDGGEGEGDGEGDEDGEKPAKKRIPPSERIRELNKRLRQEERLRLASESRLAEYEKGGKKEGLPGGNGGGNSADEIGPAPDPSDTAKYPLGHLDDRYIEDKLEYLATVKAGERADAVLQRQQENERRQHAETAQAALLEKVDDLAARGSEMYDDYQESVVEAGMRGDWDLGQATFEAAHEADNGHQILYELSQDKKEASRVAALSPYQQLKFVQARDAEIAEKAKARKIPGAGAPPSTKTKGANSSTRINPATDNLDDFEKAWAAEGKGK